MMINIYNLNITKINEEGTFIPYPIWESEYYKALMVNFKQSEEIYDEYQAKLSKYHYKKPISQTKELSYDKFLSLYLDIKWNGFDTKLEPKIRIINNEVTDGQHRLSILYYLYPRLSVEIDKDGYVIDILENARG